LEPIYVASSPQECLDSSDESLLPGASQEQREQETADAAYAMELQAKEYEHSEPYGSQHSSSSTSSSMAPSTLHQSSASASYNGSSFASTSTAKPSTRQRIGGTLLKSPSAPTADTAMDLIDISSDSGSEYHETDESTEEDSLCDEVVMSSDREGISPGMDDLATDGDAVGFNDKDAVEFDDKDAVEFDDEDAVEFDDEDAVEFDDEDVFLDQDDIPVDAEDVMWSEEDIIIDGEPAMRGGDKIWCDASNSDSATLDALSTEDPLLRKRDSAIDHSPAPTLMTYLADENREEALNLIHEHLRQVSLVVTGDGRMFDDYDRNVIIRAMYSRGVAINGDPPEISHFKSIKELRAIHSWATAGCMTTQILDEAWPEGIPTRTRGVLYDRLWQGTLPEATELAVRLKDSGINQEWLSSFNSAIIAAERREDSVIAFNYVGITVNSVNRRQYLDTRYTGWMSLWHIFCIHAAHSSRLQVSIGAPLGKFTGRPLVRIPRDIPRRVRVEAALEQWGISMRRAYQSPSYLKDGNIDLGGRTPFHQVPNCIIDALSNIPPDVREIALRASQYSVHLVVLCAELVYSALYS
jgi:hypothetical protein